RRGESVQPSPFAMRQAELPPLRADIAAARGFGQVVSVDGARAVVAVDNAALARPDGDPLSIGRLLAIDSSRSQVIGVIYAADAADATARGAVGTTLLRVELVGEIRPSQRDGASSFNRGIQTYPP